MTNSNYYEKKCYVCATDLMKIYDSKTRQKDIHTSTQKFPIIVLWNGVSLEICENCSNAVTNGLLGYKETHPDFKPPTPTKLEIEENFESFAEQLAYPIIRGFAVQNKWKFVYQKKVGYQGGGYSTKKEYYQEQGWEHGDWVEEGSWEDSSWESEEYRIDFVLEKNNKKFALEIDGAEWHASPTQIQYDKIRDSYLRKLGYEIVRVEANIVLHQPVVFENILKCLEMKI